MRVRALVGRLVPPVIFVLMLPVAFAATTVMQRDRADNFMSFTYDADANEISEAASSIRYRRGDPVTVTTTVQDADTDPPLRGTITFRVNGDRTVAYDGTFTFRLVDATGQVAHEATKDAAFTLRPRAGKRAKKLYYRFDLPSGGYSVFATFVASP